MATQTAESFATSESEASSPAYYAALGFALQHLDAIQRSAREHGNLRFSEIIALFLREHGSAFVRELQDAELRAVVDAVTARLLVTQVGGFGPAEPAPVVTAPSTTELSEAYLEKALQSCVALAEMLRCKITAAQTVASFVRQTGDQLDRVGEDEGLLALTHSLDERMRERAAELQERLNEVQRHQLDPAYGDTIRSTLGTLGGKMQEELEAASRGFSRELAMDLVASARSFASSIAPSPSPPGEMYLRALQTSPSGAFALDRHGVVLLWNDRMALLTQISAAQATGRSFMDLLAESEEAAVAQTLQRAMHERRALSFEVRFSSGGRIADLRVNLSCIGRRARGVHFGMLGVVGGDSGDENGDEDEELKEADFLRILDGANAPVFMLDIDGRIQFWNRNIAEKMGVAKSAAEGAKLLQFVTGDATAGAQQVLQNSYIGIESENCIIHLDTADRRRLQVAFSVRCLRRPNGSVRSVVGVGQDFSSIFTFQGRIQNTVDEFSRLLRSCNAPVLCVDEQLRITEWNHKLARLTGYSRDEALGHGLEVFWAGSDAERTRLVSVLKNALQGQETEDFECLLRSKSGGSVHLVFNLASRRDLNTAIIGVFAVGQDVTEIIRHRNESIQLAEDYRNLIDTANAPIFCVDHAHRITQWNRKLAELSGYGREECCGKPIEAFIEQYATVKKIFDRALKGETTDKFELQIVKDNVAAHLLLSATPTRRNDAINGVVSVGQDITQLRQLSDQQDLLVDDLTRLIDSANAPIFGVDRSLCVTEWNQKAEALSGRAKSETAGTSFLDFVKPVQKASVRDILEAALRGRDTANYQFSLESADGRDPEILLNATSRRAKSGEIIGVVGVGQDITDRVELELARHRQNEERARANAEVEFTHFLAHEVRNPLSGIDSCLQFLGEHDLGALPATVRDSVTADLGHMRACAQYMVGILDDTLDLGKIAAKEMSLKREAVSLRTVVEDCRKMVMHTVKPTVTLVAEVVVDGQITDTADVVVLADVMRLKQIVINLLGNATKFTEHGQVVLTAARLDRDAVQITVQDTGPGIPLAQQQHLFSKYKRGAGLRKTGLGLTVCCELVNMMGGDMSVDRSYTQGTRIEVLLPLKEVAQPQLVRHTGERHDPESLPSRLRCLICDDSNGGRRMLIRRLERLGRDWDFAETHNGESALQLAQKCGFDLIFMDEHMDQAGGVLVGHEVCAQLRTEGFEGIIVGCSGDRLKDLFLKSGATLAWSKPLPRDADMQRDLRGFLKQLPGSLHTLIVDDQKVTRKVVRSRLARMGHNSWTFIEAGSVGEALSVYESATQRVDLIVVDEDFGAGSSRGEDFIRYARTTLKTTAIIVGLTSLESAVQLHLRAGADICWQKPFPNDERLEAMLGPLLKRSLLTPARRRDHTAPLPEAMEEGNGP